MVTTDSLGLCLSLPIWKMTTHPSRFRVPAHGLLVLHQQHPDGDDDRDDGQADNTFFHFKSPVMISSSNSGWTWRKGATIMSLCNQR